MAFTPADGDNGSNLTAINSSTEADDDDHYYYYYATDEQLFTCRIYDFAIEALLIGLLCAFGFVGNSLSTICLLRDGSKSTDLSSSSSPEKDANSVLRAASIVSRRLLSQSTRNGPFLRHCCLQPGPPG